MRHENKSGALQPRHTLLVLAAIAAIAFSPLSVRAETASVAIPAGEPMAPNPITAQAKLVEKKGTFGGVERTWYEYVPASYTGSKAVPLIVAVHGGSADGPWMFKATAWAQIADQLGFIVIYPNGSIGADGKYRWNAYPEFNNDPGMAISANNGVDEAKFFKELIEKTEKDYKIDPTRIYMHGQSNGGMMTSYFGLRYPGMLAAMGVGSAPPSIDVMSKYPVTTKLPTYFWSGETDVVAGQYNPANKSRAALCKEFPEFWAAINKTETEPKLRLDGLYNTLIYSGSAEVRSTEFRNGIHTLPFTAAYLIWNDFFSRYARGADGQVVHLTPDDQQAAPPDKGAVAVKLGTPFALVDDKVVRLGKTPNQTPIITLGVPSFNVLVPADFVAGAIGGTADYKGDSEVRITTKAGIAGFTVGGAKMTLNGKETKFDASVRKVDGDLMVSFNALAAGTLNKTVSTRKDVYRNDIYYVNDRPADLSAQTITYIDQKLLGTH